MMFRIGISLFSRSLCNCPKMRQFYNHNHHLYSLSILKYSHESAFRFNNLKPNQMKSFNYLSSFAKKNGKSSVLKEKITVNAKKKTYSDEWNELNKLSLFQRYKTMFKKYWYVAIPVHMATSAIWFGTFFIAAKCGVDAKRFLEWVKPYIEKMPLPEFIKKPLTNPEDATGAAASYVAIAYLLFKFATPARYAVTAAGTGYACKWLVQRGLIRPVPKMSKEALKKVIDDRLRSREAVLKSKKIKKKL